MIPPNLSPSERVPARSDPFGSAARPMEKESHPVTDVNFEQAKPVIAHAISDSLRLRDEKLATLSSDVAEQIKGFAQMLESMEPLFLEMAAIHLELDALTLSEIKYGSGSTCIARR